MILTGKAKKRWACKPFIYGVVTPSNRNRNAVNECRYCDSCGSVSIIGGDLLRQVKKQSNFFCDIQCAGDYKRWHNQTAEYVAKWENTRAKSKFGKLVQLNQELKSEQKSKQIEQKKWTCCTWCGIAFSTYKRHTYVCSDSCRKKAESLRRILKNGMNGYVRCQYCGIRKHFRSAAKNRKYCSPRCEKRFYKQTRNHLRRTNGPVEIIGLKTLAKKANYVCAICGIKCVHPTKANANNEYSLDHVIPLAKSGTHTWDNVQLACRLCNGRKSDTIAANTQLLLSFC